MKSEDLLRASQPYVLIDNFEINRFEKTATRFDICLDEKKEQIERISIITQYYPIDLELIT